MMETPPKSLIAVGVGGLAAILILMLVLAGVLALLPQQTLRVCAGCPPGSEFAVGNPVVGVCAAGGTFATRGCVNGEFVYNLTVEASFVSFGDVLFHIETQNGTVVIATGSESGFSVLNAEGAVVAQFAAPGGEMSMNQGWTFATGTNASTPLTNLYTILVDMGTLDPLDRGYSFVATGTGTFTGTTILPLP